MASFRKNFKPTVDEKMKTFLTLCDYIKENKTSCIDCIMDYWREILNEKVGKRKDG